MDTPTALKPDRITWADYAKGICILAVVSMYATGDVERAMNSYGWMHYFILFAKPFRMPDFFFLSGLFVARVIDRPWRAYLDTKVLHFMYFYTLWITIKFLLGSSDWRIDDGWLNFFKEYVYLYFHPTGPLWFIFMLALFFVTVRLTRAFPVSIILIIALALQLVQIKTGLKMIDRFGMYFIFFYAGHLFAPYVFRLATWARAHAGLTLIILVAWFIGNVALVWSGFSEIRGVILIAAFAGALAVLLLSTLLAGLSSMNWLRYLGANSIVVYLGFVIPVSILPKQIVKYELITNVGTASFLIIIVSITGAIALYWAVRNTPLRLLFIRPAWASIQSSQTTIKPLSVHSLD